MGEAKEAANRPRNSTTYTKTLSEGMSVKQIFTVRVLMQSVLSNLTLRSLSSVREGLVVVVRQGSRHEAKRNNFLRD